MTIPHSDVERERPVVSSRFAQKAGPTNHSSIQPPTAMVSITVSDASEGGVLRAYGLAQAVQRLGYKVEVVGFQSGDRPLAEPPPGIPLKTVPLTSFPHFLISAWRFVRQLRGTVIYASKPKLTSFGLALLVAKLTHRPLLLDMDDWEMSWHGGDSWRYRPSLRQLLRDVVKPRGALRSPHHPLYTRWIERLVAQAQVLTVDTAFLQQRFGGTYLPHGQDCDRFAPTLYNAEASRRAYGLQHYRVLMFPGVPRPHKGLEDLLAALELLNEPDLRVVIVGGSPYDDYDAQLAAQWGHWLIQLPRVPNDQMPQVLAAAHVVVVPQRQSAIAQAQFPLKLTDGMAMAKPILATSVGDIPAILGDAGCVVEANSPAALATGLRWIFDHWDEAIAMGARARDRCCQHYSINTVANILRSLLLTCTSTR
ncbi:glycosyltransferase family 4 protein [Leptolyngbya sp. AN02str]|uniref:glycosyltransferase family 4 protein n=1 Tax=Leptolyngbya sp. AN02str TaxID=3423363 RepID=UPI003D319F71